MNNRCSGCRSANLRKIALTRNMLINLDPSLAPDIFPINFTYCIDCGYVVGAYVQTGPTHDGYFTYKTPADNAYPPHYHKSGWHLEFVTKGSFNYYYRPVGSQEKPTLVTISAGQLYFSEANIEHGFIFKDKVGLVSIINKGRPPNDFTVVTGDFYGF
jgi:hypothetical protein